MNLQILNHKKIQPIIDEIVVRVGMYEREYIHYLTNAGVSFLKKVVPDTHYFKLLLGSDCYWTWFINQFTIIDKAVLETKMQDDIEYVMYCIYSLEVMSTFNYWCFKHRTADMVQLFSHANLIEPAENEFIHKKVKEKV